MCIRDSAHIERLIRDGQRIHRAVCADAALQTLPLLPHFIPVSYTHLRAHETVLDLVCRLLLEKKKKHYEFQQ